MKKFFYPVFAFTAILVSCEKSDHLHGEEDLLKPNIEITSPQQLDRFSIGDTVHITGRMWDNHDLHEAGVLVHNSINNMLDCPMHVHSKKEHYFDTCYVIKPSDLQSGLKLTVKAEDHSHNANEITIDLLIE